MMTSLAVLYATISVLIGWILYWGDRCPCPRCEEPQSPGRWHNIIIGGVLWPVTIILFIWELVRR